MEMMILGVVVLVAGVSSGLAVLLVGALLPRRTCSECGELLPRFRKPQTLMQGLWGGWTCPKCSAELNRNGQKIVVER